MGIEEEGQERFRNIDTFTLSVPIPGGTHLFLLPILKAPPKERLRLGKAKDHATEEGNGKIDVLTRF